MAKTTASPPARRHNGDRLRGKAKPQRHQTKETPPPKHESAWKHENKPGRHSPFSLKQIGTLSRRHLAQFVSAIDSGPSTCPLWSQRDTIPVSRQNTISSFAQENLGKSPLQRS